MYCSYYSNTRGVTFIVAAVGDKADTLSSAHGHRQAGGSVRNGGRHSVRLRQRGPAGTWRVKPFEGWVRLVSNSAGLFYCSYGLGPV
jgi:hypothetical protein